MVQNRIVFRRQDTIGANDAEEDRFLESCFVDTGDLEMLRDCSRPERIVIGRTGAGKTALLRRLIDTAPHAIEIRPENLALTYVSNSNILNFFEELGVNLEVFYKLIWRHAFSVEVLRKRFNVEKEGERASLWERVKAFFKGQQHNRAIQYLEQWGNKFWEEVEVRIKELTTRVESILKDSIKGTVGLDPLKINGGAEETKTISAEVKKEIITRAQRVVSQHHIPQLNEILDLVRDVLDDPQKPYYLVIDRLDENWVDEKLRYKLIMALLENAKEFRRAANIKVVISLRIDLLTRVYARAKSAGFQEEKYQSLYLTLDWRREFLRELIQLRLNELYRDRYAASKTVLISEVFVGSRKAGADPVDYILDRTLMRPRDVIAFVNECIKNADGSATISTSIVQLAERSYSGGRLRSVCDEWSTEFPNLETFAKKLLKGAPARFKLGNLRNEEDIQTVCLEYVIGEPHGAVDELSIAARRLCEGETEVVSFLSAAIAVLELCGIVRVKRSAREPFDSGTQGTRRLHATDLTADSSVEVHPMFWEALQITAAR